MKRPAKPARSCGQCAHVLPVPEATGEPIGSCRRYPPVAIGKPDGAIVSTFPQVRLADIWCGEFQRRGK
jgi:hypothetical protein